MSIRLWQATKIKANKYAYRKRIALQHRIVYNAEEKMAFLFVCIVFFLCRCLVVVVVVVVVDKSFRLNSFEK